MQQELLTQKENLEKEKQKQIIQLARKQHQIAEIEALKKASLDQIRIERDKIESIREQKEQELKKKLEELALQQIELDKEKRKHLIQMSKEKLTLQLDKDAQLRHFHNLQQNQSLASNSTLAEKELKEKNERNQTTDQQAAEQEQEVLNQTTSETPKVNQTLVEQEQNLQQKKAKKEIKRMHRFKKISDELINRLESEDENEQKTDWKTLS